MSIIHDLINQGKNAGEIAVEVDRIQRYQQYQQRLKAAKEEAFAEQLAKEARDEVIIAEIKEEARIRREKEAEELRKTAAKNLEIEMRERFFAANPDALDSDFRAALPALKERLFTERLDGEKTVESVIRAGASYSKM